jgi:hypothetical protein
MHPPPSLVGKAMGPGRVLANQLLSSVKQEKERRGLILSAVASTLPLPGSASAKLQQREELQKWQVEGVKAAAAAAAATAPAAVKNE